MFQVVVPRIEDDGVQYKEPFPVDLLPFEERNDKFVGIGTAFAILGKLYVQRCKSGTEDSKAELKAACKHFQEAVKIDPTANE